MHTMTRVWCMRLHVHLQTEYPIYVHACMRRVRLLANAIKRPLAIFHFEF